MYTGEQIVIEHDDKTVEPEEYINPQIEGKDELQDVDSYLKVQQLVKTEQFGLMKIESSGLMDNETLEP